MKKLKSLFKKHGARIGALAMCFMLLIPMLCSMASTSDVIYGSISNPNNIPQDMTITINDVFVSIGDFAVNGLPVYASDGLLYIDSESNPDSFPTLPDGDYLMAVIFSEQDSSYDSMLHVVGDVHYGSNGSFVTVADSISCEFVEGTTDIGFDVLFVLVPIVPSPTDSITSVWTSITNWVISSLNTVQGVFVNSGIHYYVNEYPDYTLTYDGNSYGAINYDEFFSYRYMWYDGHRIDSLSELTQSVITVDGTQFGAYSYDGTVLAFSDGLNYMAIDNGLLGVSNSPEPNSLTLLGTLIVIGLSISLALLVIGVISRFLKLRG